jgi:hypothetical protein
MVRDRGKLSSVLDLAPQKSISLAKMVKNVSKNCKNAGLCFDKKCVELLTYSARFSSQIVMKLSYS